MGMKKYSIAKNKLLLGIFSGWGAQVVSLAMGIFTMPLFFRYLPKDELGVWMFFLGTGFFVNLADLGFSPVLGRHLAFALGHGDKSSTNNYEGASYYYRLSKYVSSITAPLLFVCLFLVGGMFIWSLHLSEALFESSIVAWAIFSLSQAVTCHFKYLETTLKGHGEVGWQNMTQTIVQGLTLLGYFIVLHFLMGGVIALSVVILGRNIANAFLVWLLLQKRIDQMHMAKVKIVWHDVKPHIRPALDMFLLTLGAFLILNTDQYFIVKFLGTAQLPDYAAAYRLVQITYTFAATAATMCAPFISRKSAAGDHAGIRRVLMLNITVGMLIQLAAVSVLAVFGDYVMQFWLGPGHFVGWGVVWVFCIMLTLENHHAIFAHFGLSAKNDPTWGKMSLISGAINLVFTFIGVKWFGLIGVAVSTMLAQMLTNNWYAVVKTMRIVNLRFSDYVQESGVIWFVTGIVLLAAMFSVRSLISGPAASLLTGITVAVLLCCSVIYLYLKKMLVTTRP
ncbi:MAG: polysaccharide biosynthesis [Desulfobulbaceae bacterium]|nr:MAG: polysaccharide biosynthesis [Desulfobulbaceae bacterium]